MVRRNHNGRPVPRCVAPLRPRTATLSPEAAARAPGRVAHNASLLTHNHQPGKSAGGHGSWKSWRARDGSKAFVHSTRSVSHESMKRTRESEQPRTSTNHETHVNELSRPKPQLAFHDSRARHILWASCAADVRPGLCIRRLLERAGQPSEIRGRYKTRPRML